MNTHTSVRGPTTVARHSGAGRTVRTILPFAVAFAVCAPALMHALDGSGSWMTVALVFGVTLAAVWVLCAIGLSVLADTGRSTTPRHGEAGPVDGDRGHRMGSPATSTSTTSHPLARIAVARVPADQAIHTDVDGHVTAATSTMGDMR